MRALSARIFSWRRVWTVLALLILFSLVLTTVVSANAIRYDEMMWTTICHSQPSQLDGPQTMVIYWSALDKCLSFFNDFIGACPNM